ncbi:MAG: DUF5666 domain-containing protein [Pseudomonadota bacterium]
MTALDRRAALAGIGAALLGACAPGSREGAGVADARKDPAEGGIGGTGIVGVLTDFGSLVINGLRIETDGATEVTTALGPADLDALAVGKSLTVEAATIAGRLVARRVLVDHPVIGRPIAISPDGRSAVVAGVNVVLEEGALGAFAPDRPVAVSGVWRGDLVIASRIDRARDDAPDLIAGETRLLNGALAVGGRPVSLSGGERIEPGGYVTFTGRAVAKRFVASTLTPGRFTGAGGPLERLSVEGYLDPVEAPPFYAVSGLGHSFSADARLGAFAAGRTLFEGRYVGTFAVDTGLDLPQSFEERRALLRRMALEGAEVQRRPARG